MKNSYLLQTGFRVPQWKLSLISSIAIHLLAVVLIFLVPTTNKESEKPIVTRLLTPDEWLQEFPREIPSDAPPKELYGARRGSSAPKQVIPRRARQTPIPAPIQPRALVPRSDAVPNALDRDLADRRTTVPRDFNDSSVQSNAITNPSPKSSGIPLPPSPSLREKLFDREVVGQVAKREEKTHDNSITFDSGEFRYESYMLKLKEKIESIWKYPPDAARRGIHGDLYIRFTIRRNGRLGDIEVVRVSGHRMLDEAAMQALKEGEPYWPLPDEWSKDSLTITGHFIYSIYGTYIR